MEGQWNQGGPSAGGEQTQTQVTIPKDVSNIYQGLQYQNGNFTFFLPILNQFFLCIQMHHINCNLSNLMVELH